jgi:hypothetical protein
MQHYLVKPSMTATDGRREPNSEQLYESLRMLYREHTDQARHHDTLRERSTAVVVALAVVLATAAIGYLEPADTAPFWALALSLPIVAAGVFGMHLSSSHSHSNRQHVQIARAFRMALQVALARISHGDSDVEIPKQTERTISEAMKWLADEFSTQIEVGKPSSSKEKEHLHCLLSYGLIDKHNLDLDKETLAIRGERFGSKCWCNSVREALDKSLQGVAPYDFQTIRDYGVARNNLHKITGKKSFWTRYVEWGWYSINASVAIFGLTLSILIFVTALISIFKP